MEISEHIKEFGMILENGIAVLSIIGEIEGHMCLSADSKTTKYEHILPLLCGMDMAEEISGVLFLINTVGGDISCGLAIAEMIAGMKKPTVAFVIGDSHSIGLPITVAAKKTFIAKTATIVVHPVRMSGMVIGAKQTMDQFEAMQERIAGFVEAHTDCSAVKFSRMMMSHNMSAKDLGTLLVGEEAVKAGLIQRTGSINDAFCALQEDIKYVEH